jgi:Membrane-fusion protein
VRIDYVYPTGGPSRRTWKARASVDNAAGFVMPGMFVAARLELRATQPMLMIPREAVIQTGDGDRVVLALGDNRHDRSR